MRWASAALGMVTEDVEGEERDAADGRLLQEAGQRAIWQRRVALPAVPAGRAGPLVGARAAGGLDRHTPPSPPRTLVRSAVEGVCMQLALVALAWSGRRARAGGARHWWGDGVAGVA